MRRFLQTARGGSRDATQLDLVRLKRELEELTHRAVDVVTESALSPYMRDQVLAEAVAL